MKTSTPIVIAGLVLVLAGCTSNTEASNTAPAASASPTPTVTAQAPGPTSVSQMPAWDQTTREEAQTAGVEVFGLFARPKTPAKQWFDDLAPRLTPAAVELYRDVDPARIPVDKISGPVKLLIEEANRYEAHVVIPTKLGSYDIKLLRNLRTPQWHADAITPPDGQK